MNIRSKHTNIHGIICIDLSTYFLFLLLSLIQRPTFFNRLEETFQVTPVVALIGPRQCGKTTIADLFGKALKAFDTPVHRFDLEDERDVAKLQDPMLMLSSLKGLIIIDEIHHIPGLFKSLRVLVDQKEPRRNFLCLEALQESFYGNQVKP